MMMMMMMKGGELSAVLYFRKYCPTNEIEVLN